MATSWRVALADRLAKQIITVGGLATIAAVLLVAVVLVVNTIPLTHPTTIELTATQVSLPANAPGAGETPSVQIHAGVDEFVEQVWFVDSRGHVTVRSVATDRTLASFPNPAAEQDTEVTASFRDRSGSRVLLGYVDGSVQSIDFRFESDYLKYEELEPSVSEQIGPAGEIGRLVVDGDATYRMLRGRLVRRQRLAEVTFSTRLKLAEAAAFEDSSAVRRLAALPPKARSSFDPSTETAIAALTDTAIYSGRISTKARAFGPPGEPEWTVQAAPLPEEIQDARTVGLMIDQLATWVAVATADGRIARFAIAGDASPAPIAIERAVDARIAAAVPLLGENTLLAGTADGTALGIFLSPVAAAPAEADGRPGPSERFVVAHRLPMSNSPLLHLTSSPASRMFAAVDAYGALHLGFAPTDAVLDHKPTAAGQGVREVWFSGKQDFIGILDGTRLRLHELSIGHPEASLAALVRPLWYEGYAEPQSIWQSSSAGVEAEPKLSMRPLVFGTLKATFYSMLLAVPLSIAAAVYSSEFLSKSVRSRVKPAIELMAGIPSVVLGFIAALVLAQVFREHLFAILLSVFTLLFALGLVGNLWLLLPQQLYLRLERRRTLLLCFIVPLGVAAAWPIAPPLEQAIFGGSLIRWLDGRGSTPAWPGWFLLLLPLSAVAVSYTAAAVSGRSLRPIAKRSTARKFAAILLLRYLASVAAAVGLAAAVAAALQTAGFDARGPILGSYQERNALLVGAVLGFAIIPIIYTISEDALQSVPQHLRSASLGCGATAWQTTTQIVLPTAMSGLFGAVMIGFGRAVGETMVVLMAAGNTPVMDINPFNGYRTLSATLATELPEAARDSTHFHTLFLAALLLFCFTLVANTAAEFVRMRFRKRFHQL